MTYNTNSGKYQQRAEYYYSLLPLDDNVAENQYLDIYRCILNIYNVFHTVGIRYFDYSTEESRSIESGISAIRETEGLARCWGYANELLNLLSDWRGFIAELHPISNAEVDIDEEVIVVEAVTVARNMGETLERLLDIYLEILPAYVNWYPTAKLAENQAIINFLQDRGNNYRAISNPKFYAYDRVIDTIANADIPVTADNCRFFNGVGPHISQHIKNFFQGSVQRDSSPAWTDHRFMSGVPVVYSQSHPEILGEAIINSNEDLASLNQDQQDILELNTLGELMQLANDNDNLSTDDKDYDPANYNDDHDPEDDIYEYLNEPPPWCEAIMPIPVCDYNDPLATYLWESSLEFYQQRSMGLAWAWRRAAESVCNTHYNIKQFLSDLDTIPDLPYIGEKMADVIREYYQYVEPQVPSHVVEIPDSCPSATMEDEDDAYWQRELINRLWDNGYKALAVEIANEKALPQTKSHFESFSCCTPRILEFIFTRSDGPPNIRNWMNTNLVEWLWACGNECPGPAAASYYNAAKVVARKKTIVTKDNIESVKYIGPYIAERALGELAGIVDPDNYREMRKELVRLRRQVGEF